MPDVPNFRVAVPLRCFHQVGRSRIDVCGAVAAYIRLSPSAIPYGYFCRTHRETGDLPIPESYLVNRVSVECELTIAGASFLPELATDEAVERLVGCLRSAGAVLNLHRATPAVGRYSPPLAPRWKASAGKGV